MIHLTKVLLGIAIFAGAVCASQAQSNGNLKVVFVDVEGGQATLFITPTGQSMLIDTGWPGNDGRDADRIVAAAKKAGLEKLDYVLLTHYHVDHVGGVTQLAARIAIGTFIDHGPNRELDHGIAEKGYADYLNLLAGGPYKRVIVKVGDVLPIRGMTVTIISADGRLISKPLPNGGQTNEYCKTSELRPDDQTENSRSLGVQIAFGELTLLDLGDLTWDKEMSLMCPKNKVGYIDIDIVSHHGWYQSSSPALVYAIHPRIAIMDNGETKGGSPATLETYHHAPGLEDLWQLHYSVESTTKNTSRDYIANLPGPDAGYSLELTASPDGSFEVTNGRTKTVKHYKARSHK